MKNIVTFTLSIFISCDRSDIYDSIDMNWEIVNNTLPNGIILYRGYNSKIPIKAWTVFIPNIKQNQIKYPHEIK